MTSSSKKKRGKTQEDKTFEEGEYYNIQLYDLNHNLKKKTIDLVKLIGNKDFKGFVSSLTVITYNQRDYIFFTVVEDGKDKSFLIDVETEKLQPAPEELSYRGSVKGNRGLLEVDFRTNFGNTLEEQCHLFESSIYQTVYVGNFGSKFSNLSKTNLMQEDPKLAKAIEDGGVLFTRSEMVQPTDFFDTMIYWFAPPGQDVLDLHVTDRETKEQIPIKSYADFQAWKEAHPNG